MGSFAIKHVVPIAAGVALVLASVAESAAMPVDIAPRSEAAAAGSVVDVKYVPKRRVVRRAPRHGNGNAAAAAAFGAMALGIGAAIAADRRNDYYGYGYGYPAYGYGYPAYGNGYGYGGGYYPRQRYYAPRPVYRGGYLGRRGF